MLKNKEVKAALMAIILLALAEMGLLYLMPGIRVWLSLFFALCVIIIFLIFTVYRYKKIAEISDYLKGVAGGDYSIELRDYTEGELSYLKSEIYKVTLKLREQTEMLKKDKVYLSDTLSDISHQLKTPLTSMFVMTDLLKNPDLPAAKREEFTTNISNQLERIDWLVSALLKMSKLDAGTVHLKKNTVDVATLIDRATAHLLIPMEIREQKLVIDGEEDVTFGGDLAWSSEALTNIIKNCMEHTPVGGTLKINYGQQMIYTWITIEDTGIGINPKDMPHIFERFYRGTNSKSDSVGIGLAMAKQIINLQSGKIDVESKPGKGTKFTIKFYHQIV